MIRVGRTVIVSLLIASGVVADPQVDATPSWRAFRVPPGAAIPVSSSRPLLQVVVECQDRQPQFGWVAEAAQMRLETFLKASGRFEVVRPFNRGGGEIAKGLADSGQGGGEESRPAEANSPALHAIVRVLLSPKSLVMRQAGGVVMVDYSLETSFEVESGSDASDRDRPAVAGRIRSPATTNPDRMTLGRRKFVQEYNPDTGKREWAGGFNLSDPSSVEAVLGPLVDEAMQALAGRLVLAFPISAKVGSVSDSRSRFKILCGSDRGLCAGFHMVIWLDGPHGPVGIARGTIDGCTPDSASLRVDAWNEGDPDTKPFVDQIKASGIDAVKDRLFATTADIPIREMLPPAAEP